MNPNLAGLLPLELAVQGNTQFFMRKQELVLLVLRHEEMLLVLLLPGSLRGSCRSHI
jgi:hypothetical protein